MRRVKKTVLMISVLCLILGGIQPSGWAQSATCGQHDAEKDLWGIFDLLIARPMAALAGVAGVGVVILSLPFTIPTKSVDKAADTFVKAPFRFAFERDYPDECVID